MTDDRRTTDPIGLLDRIARQGVASSEIELRDLHRLAVGSAIVSAVTAILVDATAPPIVREQAAARTVAAILARATATDPSSRPMFRAA